MIFPNATDKLQLVTTAAANLDVLVDYVDMDNTTKAVTPGRTLTKITTATTTDILAAPAAATTRKAKRVSINNVHASLANTVTAQYNANATIYLLDTWTIAAGERVRYNEAIGFEPLDANGIDKTVASQRVSGTASVAAQSGFAADTYVTGSSFPVTGRLQAGAFFRWKISMSKTGAGAAAPTFNIRFGTAGAISDTSRVLFTGPIQTTAADTAWLEIIGIFRTVGAAATIQGELKLAHNLAATGFATTGPSGVLYLSTTSSTFDSTVAGSIIGLSMNGGTSAAWTVTAVAMDAVATIN